MNPKVNVIARLESLTTMSQSSGLTTAPQRLSSRKKYVYTLENFLRKHSEKISVFFFYIESNVRNLASQEKMVKNCFKSFLHFLAKHLWVKKIYLEIIYE